MLTARLDDTLRRAKDLASKRRHTHVTTEHLLLSMTLDDDALRVMGACNVNIERLGADIESFFDNDCGDLVTTAAETDDPKPTLSFQRVVNLAAGNAERTGRSEVTGAQILIALFSERESYAVYFLGEQGMRRKDAVHFINHGVTQAKAASEPQPGGTPEQRRIIRPQTEKLREIILERQRARALRGILAPR